MPRGNQPHQFAREGGRAVAAALAAHRRLGSDVLRERFPNARPLWSLTAKNSDGYPNAFTVTAYNINGRVVILQEFAEANSWDVFVPASQDGRIDATLDAVNIAVKPDGGQGSEVLD